jgi:hypothetical protein
LTKHGFLHIGHDIFFGRFSFDMIRIVNTKSRISLKGFFTAIKDEQHCEQIECPHVRTLGRWTDLGSAVNNSKQIGQYGTNSKSKNMCAQKLTTLYSNKLLYFFNVNDVLHFSDLLFL